MTLPTAPLVPRRITWQGILPAFVIAATGAWLVLHATSRYGVALSPDAAGYLSVARNLLSGNGFVTYESLPLVDQPPFYSMLLAAVAWLLQAEPLHVAAGLNAALFAGTLLLVGVVLIRQIESALLRWIALTWLLVALPSRAVFWGLLTEPLFIFLLAVWLLLADFEADRYAKIGLNWSIVALGIVAALAMLTRYAGVALIGTGVLLLLLDGRVHWRQRLTRATLFLAVSCIPVGLWLARNWRLSGSIMGTRTPTRFTLSQNLALVMQTLGNWFFPVEGIRDLPDDLFATSVGMGAVSGAKSAHAGRFYRLLPYWLFAAVYLGVILFSASTVAYDQIGDRLLAPLMVPLCVLAAAGIDALCSRLTEKGWRWAAWTLIGVCGLVVLLVGATTIVAAQKAAEDGAGGYHRRAWMESPTLERLRGEGLPQTLPIYSNAHDALYLLLGKEAALAPRRRANNQPVDAAAEAVRLQALRCVWPQEGDAWLIWLERQQRDYLFTQEELATIATVQEVARYDDGAIYRVSGCR